MKNCCEDIDNLLIIKNKYIFDNIHLKKSATINVDNNLDTVIYIPVSINICFSYLSFKPDLINYCKYIIDTLNKGFSGDISSKYKDPLYTKDYLKNIFNKFEDNSNNYANYIYEYINTSVDTKIRFYLKSIEHFNKNFVYEYKGSTENLINDFIKNGFVIKEENKLNLNINIIKFTDSTLGVATFPWMRYLIKIPNTNIVFIDYKTIHSDININNFNKCKTLIHEVGHIFGLRHTFNNDIDSLKIYNILLGKMIFDKEFSNIIIKQTDNDINLSFKYENNIEKKNSDKNKMNKNKIDINKNNLQKISSKFSHDKSNIQLYKDIPSQKLPTIFDPIEKIDLQINEENIPVNFCCFMDYSPDEVLTHFSLFQKKIMFYFIRIFMPYFLKNSENSISSSITLNFYNGLYFDEKKNIILEKNMNITNYFYNYKIKFIDDFKYEFIRDEKTIVNIIKNSNTSETITNFLNELIKKI